MYGHSWYSHTGVVLFASVNRATATVRTAVALVILVKTSSLLPLTNPSSARVHEGRRIAVLPRRPVTSAPSPTMPLLLLLLQLLLEPLALPRLLRYLVVDPIRKKKMKYGMPSGGCAVLRIPFESKYYCTWDGSEKVHICCSPSIPL